MTATGVGAPAGVGTGIVGAAVLSGGIASTGYSVAKGIAKVHEFTEKGGFKAVYEEIKDKIKPKGESDAKITQCEMEK